MGAQILAPARDRGAGEGETMTWPQLMHEHWTWFGIALLIVAIGFSEYLGRKR